MKTRVPVLAALGLVATALLSPRPSAAQTPGTGAIIGTVRDSAGHGIAGAVVTVRDRQVSSNSEGVFELASVPTGQYPLYVRRVGYASQTMQVKLFEGDTLNARLTLVRVVTLDSIDVVSSRSNITEFEERRLHGAGYYITQADLKNERSRRVAEVLGRVPGMRVQGRRGESYAEISRATTRCLTSVFLDGVPVYTKPWDAPFNLNTLSVTEIEGIEFYRSEVTPAKYSRMGASCGALVIWTRR